MTESTPEEHNLNEQPRYVAFRLGGLFQMCASSLGRYKVGDTAESGREIAIIHGQSTVALVFEDTDGKINWKTQEDPLPRLHTTVLDRFDKLHSLTGIIPNEGQQRALDRALARALFRALSETDEKSAGKHFSSVQEDIHNRFLAHARISYAASALCVVAAVLVILGGPVAFKLVVDEHARTVLVATTLGAVGAWTSIVQRAWQLSFASFEPPHHLAFQGATRVILGAVFGTFVVVTMKANVVLPMLSDTRLGIRERCLCCGSKRTPRSGTRAWLGSS